MSKQYKRMHQATKKNSDSKTEPSQYDARSAGWKKLLIPSVIVLLFCWEIGLSACGRSSGSDDAGTSFEVNLTEADHTAEATEAALAEDEILYGGTIYKYNSHLSNFLFLGIDTEEAVETTNGRGAGQSDAIYLVSWNRVTGDTTLITIPRDTMTEIEVFDYYGKSLGYQLRHLNLAYAYGDGSFGSCKLAANSVSRLLYDIPITGYASMTLDSITAMIDQIGDLTVTVPNDSLADLGEQYQEGQILTLTADNVTTFVRTRDITVDNSALDRMERQQVFLDAAFDRIMENYQSDPGSLTSLYVKMSDYMITNIGTDQFAKIMAGLAGGAEVIRWTLPGEAVVGGEHDEYHVDEELLLYEVIGTFYTEKR